MSPRRRDAKLAAQVSDDHVLVAPSRWTPRHVGKRTLEGRRITRQQPHALKIIHGVGAYLILVALATGCAPSNPTMQKDDMSRVYQDHHACVVEAEKMVGFGTRGRLYYYEICMKAQGYR